jgi:hypothetical protein
MVVAIRLADAGGGLGFPFIVHLTPLRADLPVAAIELRPRRLS